MKTKTTLSVSHARKSIFHIVDEVQADDTYYTLTERGYPKAVVLSAEKFEAMTFELNGQMVSSQLLGPAVRRANLLADGKNGKRPVPFSKVFIIRDESKIVYLSSEKDNRDLRGKEEELVRAQLYVKLVEEMKYPMLSLELGRYVRIGGPESRRYIEADIILNDSHGNVHMIFETSTLSEYEKNIDKTVADLFDLASALAWVKKPKYLVYFSRAFRNQKESEKILIIDAYKFNSFHAWKKAGRPGKHELPKLKLGVI